MAESIESFIISELTSKDIPFQIKKNWIQTFCPFHSDTHRITHLGIRKDGKLVHCFSCKYKGTWNDYAKVKNLKLITEDVRKANVFNDLLFTMNSMFVSESVVELPPSEPLDTPWYRYSTESNYRGPDLPVPFLRKLDVKKTYDDYNGEYRLLLPVNMFGELVGWVNVWYMTVDTVKDKVKNMKGEWVKEALYPIDYVKNAPYLVLVEGQYDALRLIYEKIPAVSIFGTNNWTSSLVDVIKVFSFKHIFVLMDGDRSGRDAGIRVYNDLVEQCNVTLIDLPDGRDPGNLKQDEIKKLKKLFKKKRNEEYIEIETF